MWAAALPVLMKWAPVIMSFMQSLSKGSGGGQAGFSIPEMPNLMTGTPPDYGPVRSLPPYQTAGMSPEIMQLLEVLLGGQGNGYRG